MPERGEIWLANLNPRRGTEPGKSRPVLIVQGPLTRLSPALMTKTEHAIHEVLDLPDA